MNMGFFQSTYFLTGNKVGQHNEKAEEIVCACLETVFLKDAVKQKVLPTMNLSSVAI